MSQAFLPSLTRSRGTIVNNVSLAALAPVPLTPAYSISKAAAFSLTQSLRLLLARQGVSVHSVLTGPTDTEMTRGFDIPKASPESVARAIFDGIENGEEDIFPDPLSQRHGRRLARRCRQAVRAPERGARAGRGRQLMTAMSLCPLSRAQAHRRLDQLARATVRAA